MKRALLEKTTENIYLLEEVNRLKKEIYILTAENQGIAKIFTERQRKYLGNLNKRIYWTSHDIAPAISLHSAGPRSYRWLLKNKYPFPAESTLRRWASKITVQPGALPFVFQLMKNAELTKFDKVCVIMADEMKIKKSYDYDKKTDTMLPPANYVQVVMARGLFSNWKQPIFFDFDCQLTKSMLNFLIEKLEEIDFNVVAIVSDMGGGNRKFWNTLDVSKEKPFF